MKADHYHELKKANPKYSVGELDGCYVLRLISDLINIPGKVPVGYYPITENEFDTYEEWSEGPYLPFPIENRPVIAAENMEEYDEDEWISYHGIPCRFVSYHVLSPYVNNSMDGWCELLSQSGFTLSDQGEWSAIADMTTCPSCGHIWFDVIGRVPLGGKCELRCPVCGCRVILKKL
jgi:hypothetical protein